MQVRNDTLVRKLAAVGGEEVHSSTISRQGQGPRIFINRMYPNRLNNVARTRLNTGKVADILARGFPPTPTIRRQQFVNTVRDFSTY